MYCNSPVVMFILSVLCTTNRSCGGLAFMQYSPMFYLLPALEKLQTNNVSPRDIFETLVLLIWMDQVTLEQFKAWFNRRPWLYSRKYGISGIALREFYVLFDI